MSPSTKRPRFDAVAPVLGLAHYGLLYLWAFVFGVTAPYLGELYDDGWRRAAFLGYLALLSLPVWGVASAHRIASRVIDKFDGGSGRLRESLWAGFVSWLVLAFASATTGLVLAIISPPRHGGSTIAILHEQASASTVLHVAVWTAIATLLIAVERSARHAR